MLDRVEIYDPRADKWTKTGSLNERRAEDFFAALLPDGRVLVAGEFVFTNPIIVTGGFVAEETPQSSADLYDTATGTWSSAGSMSTARGGHNAVICAATAACR